VGALAVVEEKRQVSAGNGARTFLSAFPSKSGLENPLSVRVEQLEEKRHTLFSGWKRLCCMAVPIEQ
jgi:hypothetical protein